MQNFEGGQRIDRKTAVLESLFNKVAGLQACNFIKRRLQRNWFPVKFVKILRTPIFRNICEGHLRKIQADFLFG